MKGILWGILGLTFLDLVLNSNVNLPGAFTGVATWLADWMSPSVPLLKASANTSSTGTPPTSPAQINLLSSPPPPFSLPPPSTGGVVTTGSTIAIS